MKPTTDWPSTAPLTAQEKMLWQAAFYARRLRENEHLSVAEAARRVIERYPHTKPLLQRLTYQADSNKPA